MVVSWEHTPTALGNDIGDWLDKMFTLAVQVAQDIAVSILEADAKANAPWTDRTGNARQGLTGTARKEGTAIVLYLFHTMDYGIWLEVAHAGNYAVIMETIMANAAQIIEEVGAVFGGKGRLTGAIA